MHLETEERGKKRIYRIRKDVTTLGRDLACDISVSSVSVSRRHVAFVREGAALRFRDLGSRNGVRLNGKPEKEGILNDGDRLSVGHVAMAFRSGEAPSAAEAPEPAPRPAAFSDDAPTPVDAAFAAPSGPPATPHPLPPAPPPSEAGAGSAAADAAAAPGVPRRKVVLLATAAAAVLVLVAAVVLKVVLAPKPPPPPPAYGPAEYVADALASLQLFESYDTLRRAGSAESGEKIAEARAILRAAQGRLPADGLAGLLDRAMSFHERMGNEFAALSPQDAWEAWGKVKEHRGLPPEVQAFATARQQWIDAENDALAKLKAAQEHAASAKRDELIAEFGNVPADSMAGPKAAEAIARLKAEGLAEHLARARAEEGRGAWPAALKALEAASAYAVSPEHQDELAGLRAGVSRKAAMERTFREAEAAWKKGRLQETRTLLASLPEGHPYREQASRMLADIAQRESTAAVRALFDEGKGQEALAALKGLPGGTVDPRTARALEVLIGRTMEVSRQARAEELAGRLIQARKSCAELAEFLRGPEHDRNAYRKRAAEFLERWTDDALADHYVKAGEERMGAEDFAGAREAFDLARECDPAHQKGVEPVRKSILPRTKRMRSEAYGLKVKGDAAGARDLLKRVQEMLRPGDQDYEAVKRELAGLDKDR